MSWSDILYPGNSDRRAAVVRKLQDLLDSMAGNFRATNKLVQYLNDNITESNLPKIYVDSSKSLRDNADVLVNQIKAIDAVLDKIHKELKQKLEPDLYAKLTNVDTSFEQKVSLNQSSKIFTLRILTLYSLKYAPFLISSLSLSPSFSKRGRRQFLNL